MNAFVSNKPGETITDKLGLGTEIRELKFGAGFSGNRGRPPKNESFHTIRYDFKPASVDTTQQTSVEVDRNNQVTISIPHADGTGSNVFKGPRKPYAKECVLIIDHVTGEVTLEKLTDNITVKKTRAERPEGSVRPVGPSKPPAPAPPPPPDKKTHSLPPLPPSDKNLPTAPPLPPTEKKTKAQPPVPAQPPNRKKNLYPDLPPPRPPSMSPPSEPPPPPLPTIPPSIVDMVPMDSPKKADLSEMSSSDESSSSSSSSQSESESSDDEDLMDVDDVPIPTAPLPTIKHLPKLPILPSHKPKPVAPSMPLFDSDLSSHHPPSTKGHLSANLVSEDLQLSEESDSDSD